MLSRKQRSPGSRSWGWSRSTIAALEPADCAPTRAATWMIRSHPLRVASSRRGSPLRESAELAVGGEEARDEDAPLLRLARGAR